MDPVSAISLAGSVVNIVGAVTGMIRSLHELRRHWKEADLTVALLISQLTTLKAALNQIAEWISSSLVDVPQYRQLIIDLEESLSSCNVLITFIDHHIAKLAWNEAQALNYESRVRVVLEDKATKDCLDHLNNQTNALNLLLTVFNCRTQSEQKELLERERSRRVFERIRDDSSSLVVLYDSDSLFSSSTDTEATSLRLSKRFIFDGELLGSKVYQGTMRSLIRRVMHRRKDARTESFRSQSTERSLPSEEKDNAARSNKIDALITKGSKEFGRKVDVLVVGLPQCGKSTFLRRMTQTQEPSHRDMVFDLSQRRPVIEEVTITHGVMKLNLIESSSECLHSVRKCLHQFAQVITILFVVDLTSFQQWGHLEDSFRNSILENFRFFDFVSNDPYFRKTTMILLFSKIDAFQPTFISRPPQQPFNHPAGGDDVDQAIEYLKAQFAQRGRSPNLLRSHVIGGSSGSDISETYRYITDTVSDILLKRNLSEITIVERFIDDSNF